MNNNNRQILKKVHGTGNDAANEETSAGNNRTIKQKNKRKVHWPTDLLDLVQCRLIDDNNDDENESSKEEQQENKAKPESSKRHIGREMSRLDKQQEREKRKQFLQMDNNDEEIKEEDVQPKQEEEEDDDIIYLSEEDGDDGLEVVFLKIPWRLYEVDIDLTKWNLPPAMLKRWPFGGGKNSQTKWIEEARWAKTTENRDLFPKPIETGEELSTHDPNHETIQIPLDGQIVGEEIENNVNGNEYNMEGENYMEEEIENDKENRNRSNSPAENQQQEVVEDEQMEINEFYNENVVEGGDEENVVNGAGEENEEAISPQNIVETTTKQAKVATGEETDNHQIELDRNPCCSKKIKRFLATLPDEDVNEESKSKQKKNENQQQQNDGDGQIKANQSEVVQSLMNCFAEFGDEEEEDDEVEKDGLSIQKSNYRIGNLRMEPQKTTLPKIKIDPDEENSPTDIQPIINDSNQQEHVVTNDSTEQIDKNVEENEQGNQGEMQNKKENTAEKLKKRERKKQEKRSNRVQQQQHSSHQSSCYTYSSSSLSPPSATISRHANLQRFPPPTPNLIDAAGLDSNINYGANAGGTNFNCVFYFGRDFCTKGSKCNFLRGAIPTRGTDKYLRNNRREVFIELMSNSTSKIRPASPIRSLQPPPQQQLIPSSPLPQQSALSEQLLEALEMRQFSTSFSLPPAPPPQIALPQEAEMSPQPSSIMLATRSSNSKASSSPRKSEHRHHHRPIRSHSRRSRSSSRRSHYRHSSSRRHYRSRSRSKSISQFCSHRSRSHSRVSIRHHQTTAGRSRSSSRTRIIIEFSDNDEQQSNKSRNSDDRPMPHSNPHTHHIMQPPAAGNQSFTKLELHQFVKDCPHFVQKGWCSFGRGCCFSHGDAQPTRGYQNAERRNREYRSLSQGVLPLAIPSRKDDENASSETTSSCRARSRSRSRSRR